MLAARWGHRKSTDIDLTVPDGSGMAEARRLHGDEIRARMTSAGARRNAAYRIDREAPETLHGVRNEFTRFTKDLCRHARKSLTNSRYLSVAIRRDGDEICLATRTLIRPNTIRSEVSELNELLERSGMNEYLKNPGPGQATVSERIERALADGTGAYTPLVTQPARRGR